MAFGVLLALATLSHSQAGVGPPCASAPAPFGTGDLLAALHLVRLTVGAGCVRERVG